MTNLLKELIISLDKEKLDSNDILKISSLVEALLNMPQLDMGEISLVNILLHQIDLFKSELCPFKFLNAMISELKLKMFRLGINSMDNINPDFDECDLNQDHGRLVNNVQAYSPMRDIGVRKIVDYRQYEDGHIEAKKLFDIHPDLNFDGETEPIFNDYAQVAINISNK